MKLRSLTISGFRGFNQQETIVFDPRLTLVAASNSYGKTSVTEALEFLLYGETSKITYADSKDEYKHSYRNRHHATDDAAVVAATFEDTDGSTVTLRVELDSRGEIKRSLDGRTVQGWSYRGETEVGGRPFVVQHALKELLLTAPSLRYQRFARLLGLTKLEAVQQALINLCTKPMATIPDEPARALRALDDIDRRMAEFTALRKAARQIATGSLGGESAYAEITARAHRILRKRVGPGGLLADLIAERDRIAKMVYKGGVSVRPLTPGEDAQVRSHERRILDFGGDAFVEAYSRVAAEDAIARLRREVEFLGLGLELLAEQPSTCVLCQQPLDEGVAPRIEARLSAAKKKLPPGAETEPRGKLTQNLARLSELVEDVYRAFASQIADLEASQAHDNATKLAELFGKDHAASWEVVRTAAGRLAAKRQALLETKDAVTSALDQCRTALADKQESVAQAEQLSGHIRLYLKSAGEFRNELEEAARTLAAPAEQLSHQIDVVAGTAEIALIVRLLQGRKQIERALAMRDVLIGLKDMKRIVEQAGAAAMDKAFSRDLTESVMKWYSKIRTIGDPDVHFAGFAMGRSKTTGGFLGRRVDISAKSYGVDLASAVSSLSESKLNALGLCTSIAASLRSDAPWRFLVLDDPIQSWDEAHEFQFIEIVRSLVEDEGRQVILLSHREKWLKQVANQCLNIGGKRYELTGYTKAGPEIVEKEWQVVSQRLKDIHRVANDSRASSEDLQRAEAEVRIVIEELTVDAARRILKRTKTAGKLSSSDVRTILMDAKVDSSFVQKVVSTFDTTDPSHHSDDDFQPSSQRVRQYHGIVLELKRLIDAN